GRQQFLNGRLLKSGELREEPPLGEQLVDESCPDGVRLLVRSKVEQVVGDRPPDAHSLVDLAGVGADDVLKSWLDRPGHVNVRYGNVVVLHESATLEGIGILYHRPVRRFRHQDSTSARRGAGPAAQSKVRIESPRFMAGKPLALRAGQDFVLSFLFTTFM